VTGSGRYGKDSQGQQQQERRGTERDHSIGSGGRNPSR
jgi:hypothetical protein